MQNFISTRFLKPIILASFLGITFISCKKTSSGQQDPPTADSTILRTPITGFITDNSDNALPGAMIEFGTSKVITDPNGFFELKNVRIATILKIEKPGFFTNVKNYSTVSSQTAPLRIKLLPKTTSGTINAATGGIVTNPSGVKITFPAAAFVIASDNQAYTGAVTVKTFYINPDAADFGKIMPGELRGTGTDGNIKPLTNFGMVAVEITGSGGEQLQLATGKKATLEIAIPTARLGSASSPIPMWYFNETTGLWKEEGTAIKIASIYRSDVSHFTYWSANIAQSLVMFDATLVNSSGTPLANTKVSVIDPASGTVVYSGYTFNSGFVSGLVPSNAQLRLQVFDNTICANPVYTQNFNTTSSNSSLGTVTLTAITHNVSLRGTVKNCNNINVSSGNIIINDGSLIVKYPLTNGTFNLTKYACSLPVNLTLIGEDLATGQQSAAVNYTLNTLDSVNFGTFVACAPAPEQFFKFTDNGTIYNYVMPNDTLVYRTTGTTSTSIDAYRIPHIPSQATLLTYAYSGATTNVGDVKAVSAFSAPLTTFGNNLSGTVTITEFGSIGQFVAASFTVTKTDGQTGIVHHITGTFRVRRTI